jgi:hypothetical protein
MATKSMLKPTCIVYEVGKDIDRERYNELIMKVGDWFSEIRNTKEPVKLAKQLIDACLKGVKPSDPTQSWDSAATSPLATRIRMACRFDMETMQPLRSANEVTTRKKALAKDRELKKRKEAEKDGNYPKEFSNSVAMDATYGDDPAVFFTTKEITIREARHEAMLEQFPQLNNVAAESKLAMLLDLQLLSDRLRFRNAAAGVSKKEIKATEKEMQDLTAQIVALERAMGIDPVSVSKMQKEKEGGTIGDAVKRFDTEEYRELREQLFAEELIMLYQMYHQTSPRTDMDGYQLDDVGLFALTRTRVVTCPKCGTKNFAGFEIDEIERYLISKGLLREVPEIEEVAEAVPGTALTVVTDA